MVQLVNTFPNFPLSVAGVGLFTNSILLDMYFKLLFTPKAKKKEKKNFAISKSGPLEETLARQ